ncbi:sigma-70 family RNA polymerase sigma factor (plasmid) [Pontibacillus sp. ALD_SL1]|uniref:sigma-70 family RNA polymerase sigma factor n=1 Tax=Pontibacillus sp. ALD_SL1 TaxID=2777185 RepID=UPI001A97C2D3|nr:sigma-70 family RNA polymerase sigma factor [Pontibacillus sp. ALD_SL1]QST02331.1 sigma-70 family RNA polymerase sigma factor [Pontibacillus sp. ALD_SL1]
MNSPIPKYKKQHVLTQSEVMNLIRKAQGGCEKSREAVIQHNIRLVLNLMKRFKRDTNTQEDLFQVGVIGLIKAVDRFDVSRGVQFSTYAVPMILGETKKYLRDTKPVKVSRIIQTNYYQILSFVEKYEQVNHHKPRVSTIAKALDLEPEDVAVALGSAEEIISIAAPSNGGNDNKETTIENQLKDHTVCEEKWVNAFSLKHEIEHLNKNEKAIIKMRYYLDQTQKETGDKLGISQAHVSRIEKAALGKLKRII